MAGGDTIRVGLTVLVAAAVLAFGSLWLRGAVQGAGRQTMRVVFEDARGIQAGAEVRVRGVGVGAVERVSLDDSGRALVALRVGRRYRPRKGDEVRIAGGLLGFQSPVVEITPNRDGTAPLLAPGAVLEGAAGPDTERIVSRGEELLENLNLLSQRLTRLAEGMVRVAEDPDLRRGLRQTVRNVEAASRSGVEIARNTARATRQAEAVVAGFEKATSDLQAVLRRADGLLASLDATGRESRALMTDSRALVEDTRGLIRGAGSTVQGAGDLVADARAAVNENRDRIAALFESLQGSLKQLDATLAETRSLVADPVLRDDLRATAANVREATKTLQGIAGDVRGLTSDPEVQEDLRATLEGLREATEEAASTFRQVRETLGRGGQAAKSVTQRLSETEFRVDALHGARTGRTRFDLDAAIPWNEGNALRLGMYDLGERNRFNIQAARRLQGDVWGRFGFHASRLGAGIDLGGVMRSKLSFDLYGVREPRLDLRGSIPLAPYFDLTIGLDDLGRRPDPVIGVRYRR